MGIVILSAGGHGASNVAFSLMVGTAKQIKVTNHETKSDMFVHHVNRHNKILSKNSSNIGLTISDKAPGFVFTTDDITPVYKYRVYLGLELYYESENKMFPIAGGLT